LKHRKTGQQRKNGGEAASTTGNTGRPVDSNTATCNGKQNSNIEEEREGKREEELEKEEE
jgi:hypothetical protein